MRKDIFLPGVALAGGVLGFGLRRWQLASAYVADTQLFLHKAPATVALMAVLAVSLVLLLLLNRSKGRPVDDFLPAFRCHSPVFAVVIGLGALLLLCAGGMSLVRGLETLALWRSQPDAVQLALPLVMLLCGGLSIPAGLGLLVLQTDLRQDKPLGPSALLLPCPGFAGVFWVLIIHLTHGVDPLLMGYGILLLAAVFLSLAWYYAAAFFFDRCRPRRLVFCALAGTVFGLTALADSPALPDLLLTLGLMLPILALTSVLLRNLHGPAWFGARQQDRPRD